MEYIAVEGCSLRITDSSIQSEIIKIVSSPSTDIKVNGKGVYFGDITVLVSGLTQSGYTCASGTITVSSTSSDVSENNDYVIRKGDKGSADLVFTQPSSGSPKTVNVEVEITDAGQSDVSAS